VQIVGFLPTTCPDITPICALHDHSMPCDWARIGHEITSAARADLIVAKTDPLQFRPMTF
jgi:hypothetical protein